MSITSSRRPQPRLVALYTLMVAASFAGCSSRKWVPVSGRVTMNGQPVEGLVVYFSPVSTDDPMNAGLPSRGRTSADGGFTLLSMDANKDRPGALVGTHKVTLDDERTFEKMNVKSRVPFGWQTTFEVGPSGTDKAEFDLSKR